VCKVFDWDGADLQVLSESRAGFKFQATVVDNDPDYADKTPFQVSWIDTYDADPNQKIAKLDKEGITKLQAKYAALLKAKAKPAAPAKAPAKKTASKKGVETIEKAKKAADVLADKPPEPGVITKKKKAPPAPPGPSKPVPTSRVDNFTKTDAWQGVVELKVDTVTDEQLTEVWQKAVKDVSNGQGEEVLDGEGWWAVKDRVLDAVGKF